MTDATELTLTRDSVLTLDELARALKSSRRSVEKMDLPFFMLGKRQRFIYGQVLDVLAERARSAA
jgi:hypothetical protein